MRGRILSVILLNVLALAVFNHCLASLPPAMKGTENILAVADIHFDPYASCHQSPCKLIKTLNRESINKWDATLRAAMKGMPGVGAYYTDTDYTLLTSALQSLSKTNATQHPTFAVALGDFLGHHYEGQFKKYDNANGVGYHQFVFKTLSFLAVKLHLALPNISIYPVIGNNDAYLGHYVVTPGGAFLHDVATLWAKKLILSPKQRASMIKRFPQGGYYSVNLANHIRLIGFDSVLCSPKRQGEDLAAAAKLQLHWLAAKLKQAKKMKQHVLIIMHIPLGVDVYSTLKHKHRQVMMYWKKQLSGGFLKLMAMYHNNIIAILAAHLHFDDTRIIKINAKSSLLNSLVSSISPVDGNNPSYKIYTYDKASHQLINFKVNYLNISQRNAHWRHEYDFTKIYDPACPKCSLANKVLQIKNVGPSAKHYIKFFQISRANIQPIADGQDQWRYYWCATRNVTKLAFEKCI